VPEPIDPAAIRATLGENVRAARERAQMTQEALGLATGLHPTEVTRIERGRRNPGVVTVVRLARGLSIPASDLLRGL
jgi:transcriptional regulator with XRE-family HTH domain